MKTPHPRITKLVVLLGAAGLVAGFLLVATFAGESVHYDAAAVLWVAAWFAVPFAMYLISVMRPFVLLLMGIGLLSAFLTMMAVLATSSDPMRGIVLLFASLGAIALLMIADRDLLNRLPWKRR